MRQLGSSRISSHEINSHEIWTLNNDLVGIVFELKLISTKPARLHPSNFKEDKVFWRCEFHKSSWVKRKSYVVGEATVDVTCTEHNHSPDQASNKIWWQLITWGLILWHRVCLLKYIYIYSHKQTKRRKESDIQRCKKLRGLSQGVVRATVHLRMRIIIVVYDWPIGLEHMCARACSRVYKL